VAKIDPWDRWHILFLNRQAATYRQLAEITTSPSVKGVYLEGLLSWQGLLDSVVFAAMRRAAA
jgi:hypothetical protein